MRRLGVILAASVALTAAAASCGDHAPAAVCTNLLPPECPVPAPTFAVDALPIVQARCAPCHAPDGIEFNRPFQTYDQIYAQRVSMLTQVHACKMPPPGAVPLTDDEKRTLLGWLVCGAPND